MFALVESGSITQMPKGNKGIQIGDVKYPAHWLSIISFLSVFNPFVFKSPILLSPNSPSSLSFCVQRVSAIFLAVAVPYVAFTLPPEKVYVWFVLI